jgi:hypothetical protein
MNPKNELYEQVTIRLDPSEKEDFWKAIELEGYSKDADGVKAFILETEPEPGPEKEAGNRLRDQVNEFIEKHPDEVAQIKKHGKVLISAVLKRAFKI